METVFRSFTGSLNHELSGSKLKTSNRIGAAAFTPMIPGRPSPVALPTQTLTTYSGVTPIAHASLNPKDVPEEVMGALTKDYRGVMNALKKKDGE